MAPKPDSITDVCVIGLGYIGLPTAAFFASTGLKVHGVDLNSELVTKVNNGLVPFVEPGFEDFLNQVVTQGALTASTTVQPSRTYIIAVPTPFNDDKSVDDSYVMAAADSVIDHLQGGELIILESTSPPGLTERIAERILASRPDLSTEEGDDRTIYFAHAPERVLPGNIMEEMVANDRIVGGTTPTASNLAKTLYKRFCDGKVLVTDARTAEMTKLTENSFRDVNIAFANELSMICDDLEIDVWELIRLANHHPRVEILQPGPGVGGHCIAVDPWFIVSSSPSRSNLIRMARKVNDLKPEFVLQKVRNLLQQFDSNRDFPTIAVLGISFKPDIDDLRESPALGILLELLEEYLLGKFVVVEPNISELPDSIRKHSNVHLVSLDEALQMAEVAILLVDHTEFRVAKEQISSFKLLIDTKGLVR